MKTTLHALFSLLLMLFISLRVVASPVDVNTADADSMAQALAGIGPKIAAAIVAYRKENGRFTSAEDLLNVKGIGPKVLEKNKADILLGGQAPETAAE